MIGSEARPSIRTRPDEPRRAEGLCNRHEFRLYQESRGKGLDRLTVEEIEPRLRRARTLRDKYRGVHRRQQGGARGKRHDGRARELHDHSRTRWKAELFEGAVGRFEGRLLALESELRRREDEARRAGVQERRRAVREGRLRPATEAVPAPGPAARPVPQARYRSPGRRIEAWRARHP